MYIKLPFKDLIYALRGCSGDFFLLDEIEYENHLDRKIFHDCFGETNLEILKRLCLLAIHHKNILNFIESSTVNKYKLKLIEGIKKSLKFFYDTLNTLEEKKDQFITLCAFHTLFKYEDFFEDLSTILKKIENIPYLKLFGILKDKTKSSNINLSEFYQIVFFNYKKAFYEDLWNWLIYGYLDENENVFFIKKSENKKLIFEFTNENLPDFLEQNVLKRILMHGKLIYLFFSNYNLTWQDIFSNSIDQLTNNFIILCSNQEYRDFHLINFIRSITDILLKFYSKNLVEKQNVLSHLNLIKNTHLLGNHCFWMSFSDDLEIKIKGKKNSQEMTVKDVYSCYNKSLRAYYSECQVNQIQTQVQIISVQSSQNENFMKYKNFKYFSEIFFFPEISIEYNFSELVQLFLCKETFKRYDVLFNFLLKLHQAKMNLNKMWLFNMKNNLNVKKFCIMKMQLTLLIEKLLFYYKVYVIEIGYLKFENEVKNYNDVFDLEECHTNFVNRLLKESLINIDGIRNQFENLFAFCQKLFLANQREVNEKQFKELEIGLKDLISCFDLLFSNIRAHEISSSLKYLVL